MHFPGLSHLPENRKQCPWKTSIFTCCLGPWGSQKQPSTWDNPGLLILCKHKQPAPLCPSPVPGIDRHHSGEGFKGLPGCEREGWGAEGAGRRGGNRSSLAIIRSSHRVEEDFPDPLTLRLGSERKRKHICTDPLSELPQGGARPFWPFATCRAMHTHMHS